MRYPTSLHKSKKYIFQVLDAKATKGRGGNGSRQEDKQRLLHRRKWSPITAWTLFLLSFLRFFQEIPRSQEEKLLLQATLKRDKAYNESGAGGNEVWTDATLGQTAWKRI
jgi:hypothetical protein